VTIDGDSGILDFEGRFPSAIEGNGADAILTAFAGQL